MRQSAFQSGSIDLRGHIWRNAGNKRNVNDADTGIGSVIDGAGQGVQRAGGTVLGFLAVVCAGLAHSVNLCSRSDTDIVSGNDTGHYGAVKVAIAMRLWFLWRDKVRATAEMPQLVVTGHTSIDNGYFDAFPGSCLLYTSDAADE